jgi:hypothetical protein
MTLRQWFKRLISGSPHFVIGGHDDPYMLRWFLLPRNKFFNVYLHKFLRDDDDSALHDHPWWFVSLMIKGEYIEHIADCRMIHRQAPSVAFRPAEHRHRVELFHVREPWTGKRQKIPAWTIVITGRAKRQWGFWCPKGFVHWKKFVAEDDNGNIGRGCGEMS